MKYGQVSCTRAPRSRVLSPHPFGALSDPHLLPSTIILSEGPSELTWRD